MLFAGGVWAEAIINVEDLRKEGEVGFFSSLSLSLNGSKTFIVTFIPST